MKIRHGSLAASFFAPHPTPGHGICFSPDGELLLRFGNSHEIKLLKASTLSLVCTFQGSGAQVRHATFSCEGQYILAATDDCRLLVYSVESAMAGDTRASSNINVGNEPLLDCLMGGDGQHILSCDDDGQLELWDVKEETMIRRFDPPGHASKLASYAIGGQRIVSCSEGVIGVVVLDTDTAEVLFSEEFPGLAEGRNKAAYTISRNGNWVIAYIQEQTWSDNLAVFDTRSQKHTTRKVCNGSALHAEFSANGELFLVAGRDDRIHVYNSASCDLLGILEGHTSDVMFCSGDNAGNVFVWGLKDFTCYFKLQAHTLPVLFCDISMDGGRAFSLDSEGSAYMWYLDTKGLFDVFSMDAANLCSFSLTPNSSHVAGLFDVFSMDAADLCSCSLTPSSSHVAVGYGDGSLKMWKLGLEPLVMWECPRQTDNKTMGHQTPCVAVKICPRETLIASGCRDGRLCLFSFKDGSILASMEAHEDMITCIQFNAAGTLMLTSARDGSLKNGGPLVVGLDIEKSPLF
eukprot:gene23441-30728_t